MKLKDYIKELKRLVKERPEVAEFEVVYAADDEGNSFDTVHIGPTVGSFKDRDFMDEGSLASMVADGEAEESDFPMNAVCIN